MKIADMEVRLESARLLTYKAAVLKDNKKTYTKVYLKVFFYYNYFLHFILL
jgi:hypothetical protein